MTVATINNLLKNAAVNENISKATILDRNYYGGISGDGYHQSYGSNKGGGKHGIALTALTLLAFLFFLNILQNCIQDHIEDMNHSTPQIMVLSSRIKQPREADKRMDETKNEPDKKEEKNYVQIAKRLLEKER